MPRHQAFSKLYYSKLKPSIKKSWEAEVARLKKEDVTLRKLDGKALSKAIEVCELAFTNRKLKKLFDKQSDSVKKRVEAFRLEKAAAVEDNDSRSS